MYVPTPVNGNPVHDTAACVVCRVAAPKVPFFEKSKKRFGKNAFTLVLGSAENCKGVAVAHKGPLNTISSLDDALEYFNPCQQPLNLGLRKSVSNQAG